MRMIPHPDPFAAQRAVADPMTRLTQDTARRLDDALLSEAGEERDVLVNLIQRRWLDENYPLPEPDDENEVDDVFRAIVEEADEDE